MAPSGEAMRSLQQSTRSLNALVGALHSKRRRLELPNGLLSTRFHQSAVLHSGNGSVNVDQSAGPAVSS